MAWGPYVQAACFCDMVIQDKGDVLSLIRVVDVIHHTERGPNPPGEMPPVRHPLKMVLMLKSGRALGRHEIRVVPHKPSGETAQPMRFSLQFEGDEKGCNVVVDLHYTFDMEGLYWFRVYLEEEELTAMPLRIVYHPIATHTG